MTKILLVILTMLIAISLYFIIQTNHRVSYINERFSATEQKINLAHEEIATVSGQLKEWGLVSE